MMRYALFGAIVAATLLSSACSPSSDDAGAANEADTAGGAAQTDAASASPGALTSSVDGLQIQATTSLPTNPAGTPQAEFCSGYVRDARSPGAEAIRRAGWAVTGEAEAGGYQIVSFVGSMEPGTSGTCQLTDGNIALFHDGALKALVYGAKGGSAIGSIKPANGGLRIMDGDLVSAPVADVQFADAGAVAIVPVAASDNVCDGTASVPNIHDMPINAARKKLIAAGWVPASRDTPVSEMEDPRAFDLSRQGLPEVDSCSGTGMGYCSFAYNGTAGHLSVTTVGDAEWPAVSHYGVDCD